MFINIFKRIIFYFTDLEIDLSILIKWRRLMCHLKIHNLIFTNIIFLIKILLIVPQNFKLMLLIINLLELSIDDNFIWICHKLIFVLEVVELLQVQILIIFWKDLEFFFSYKLKFICLIHIIVLWKLVNRVWCIIELMMLLNLILL